MNFSSELHFGKSKICSVNLTIASVSTSVAHILKLERYRED